MTDYISKTDLLLTLAELPQDASKREVLKAVYDMPITKLDKKTMYEMACEEQLERWLDRLAEDGYAVKTYIGS